MSELSALASSLGYSWTVGYYREYKAYGARAWKEREKPLKIRCVGGGDITLFQYRLWGWGGSGDEAVSKLLILLKQEPCTWPKSL